MAADSDGCVLTTVVTCEGDLSDPQFAKNFNETVGKLNGILGDAVKVRKLEPWNSVRVTLSIPREAALRLRKLASEGSAQLRALGILSVQVEGDQVISLRIASVNSEPQEIILQTAQDGGGSAQEANATLSRFLSGGAAGGGEAPSEKVPFKSPNVVCPSDSVVPKVPVSAANSASNTSPNNSKGFGGPFPFASMNQAIHSSSYTAAPPPPYPGKPLPAPPTVTISSPLLVNLLQNDGAPPQKAQKPSETITTSAVKTIVNSPVAVNRTGQNFAQKPTAPARTIVNRTVPFVQKPQLPPRLLNNLETEVTLNTKINSQASTSSPSALTNTSITQNNKVNSTTSPVAPPQLSNSLQQPLVANSATTQLIGTTALRPATKILPPPPPYTVAVNRPWDSVVQSSPFLDLTPSLTDLKADDLEDLLPTLERDLARSPPEIPEELTDNKRNFLINPLTGELEPQSSGESEVEELGDVFTGLPSPAAVSDDDTNSTIRPDTTDQSDSETRSSHSDSGKHSRKKIRDRGRDSPSLKPTEKIKLRLKLEKSEPINSAYKVDVSFIQQQPKKASVASIVPAGEELRVPPLHISLRGRHPAFITNKKKSKLDSAKPKTGKLKKSMGGDNSAISNDDSDDQRKAKKFKPNHETIFDADLKSKLAIHSYKDKTKERRGSDSELVKASLKFADSNGVVHVEKKRRLSQSEVADLGPPAILGSTNVGTITALPQKSRKEKNKVKDGFNKKDGGRVKSFTKNLGDKFIKQQVTLPTGEIDMEAKFKQRLLEGPEKGVPRPPHRTENVHQIMTENSSQIEKSDKVLKAESEPPPMKDKSPEPDKCNTPDRKQGDLGDKQSGRSPNSGAQGEDSGIESMDALSEKSPNQASQSPHADIPEPIKSKTQVPDMLDIEAQLAKMEGLNGVEDMNENQHSTSTKLGQCCELTSALQDSLKQGAVTLSVNASPMPVKEQLQQAEVSLVPLKSKGKEDDLEPLPVRVTPPLYTYSNPEKGRGSESPTMSDEDSNSCLHMHKSKSLLEQLLIDIPENQTPSSPSPATRSVRTRALSKLSSPELNSPSPEIRAKPTRSTTPANTKRKRHESDSSNNSLDDIRNKKPRKCSENAAELIKACMGVDAAKLSNVKKNNATGKLQDESSDSDEPLIEKVRKTTNSNSVTKNKVKSGSVNVKNVSVSTRRSVRTAIPAPNTRSKGDKIHSESEALRRKTRSAETPKLAENSNRASIEALLIPQNYLQFSLPVSEGENKRKKEVK